MGQRTRTRQGLQKVLNAVATAGPGVALDVRNYKTIILELYTSGNTTATIQFACSMQEKEPDFSSPASASNPWSYVAMSDLINNNSVAGGTGIILTGTDTVKTLEVNTNFIKWFCPIVTAYTGGIISADCDAVNDLS